MDITILHIWVQVCLLNAYELYQIRVCYVPDNSPCVGHWYYLITWNMTWSIRSTERLIDIPEITVGPVVNMYGQLIP